MSTLQSRLNLQHLHLVNGIKILGSFVEDLSINMEPPYGELETALYAIQIVLEDVYFEKELKALLPFLQQKDETYAEAPSRMELHRKIKDSILSLRFHLVSFRQKLLSAKELSLYLEEFKNLITHLIGASEENLLKRLDLLLSEQEKNHLTLAMFEADQTKFYKTLSTASLIFGQILASRKISAA